MKGEQFVNKCYINLAYDANYLKDVGSKLWKLLSKALAEEVTKSNVRSILRRRAQSDIFVRVGETPPCRATFPVRATFNETGGESQPTQVASTVLAAPVDAEDDFNTQNTKTDLKRADPQLVDAKMPTANIRQDWGEAVDVSAFYGRAEELNTLKQWIVGDRCRLVALLGMGGIGKTALSIKIAAQLQSEFEYLLWRSLRNAPPVQEILVNLIQFLSNQQETEADLPKDLEGIISRLIYYLRSDRCLLVLDNAETILGGGEHAGHYRQGYSGYGELLKRIGEARHQSCLVLTSREKPKEFLSLEGEKLPVRSLQLTGLKETEARELFRVKGSFSGSESEWREVVEHYAGNPLALKMVAAAIQELMNGSITEFLTLLNQGTLVFDDIRDLLELQFERLSCQLKTDLSGYDFSHLTVWQAHLSQYGSVKIISLSITCVETLHCNVSTYLD